ncbi:hypothetical protein C7B62_03245 [Pleurocapsa sp. CCALA 161]|uniref:hypothetical protein n=1 Tax=Pleurocapsa sp. CCALA 161 TaxID=2107688 RepID=UPI000D051F07|nr:hypothetical protein [Pleurocapsa sp. CCALA 161]PSB12084.1 hypothetical protein C7B62_03245 [Pleurocapsa sp. CCALA 161]
MRNQVWYVALLIGLMCLIRFGLSIFGYAAPHMFMAETGISLASNPQMPYAIRAWAIRDMAIAVLIAIADKTQVKMLLIGCVVIDLTDIISAYLSVKDGLFNTADVGLIQLSSTAIAALILELVAIAILSSKTLENTD